MAAVVAAVVLAAAFPARAGPSPRTHTYTHTHTHTHTDTHTHTHTSPLCYLRLTRPWGLPRGGGRVRVQRLCAASRTITFSRTATSRT
jgi:hypothetical protein